METFSQTSDSNKASVHSIGHGYNTNTGHNTGGYNVWAGDNGQGGNTFHLCHILLVSEVAINEVSSTISQTKQLQLRNQYGPAGQVESCRHVQQQDPKGPLYVQVFVRHFQLPRA